MEQNPTNITRIDDSTFTYQVPVTNTVSIPDLLQEKQGNLDQIEQLNQTISNLQTRNAAIDSVIDLAPAGVTVSD